MCETQQDMTRKWLVPEQSRLRMGTVQCSAANYALCAFSPPPPRLPAHLAEFWRLPGAPT